MKKILLSLLLLLSACQKQKPSDISPDYQDSLSDLRRSQACKETNLLEDILDHKNVVNLFQCTTWDKKFPELFKRTSLIDENSWNFFMHPLNRELFNKREVRDKIVALFKELDKKGGLDEVGNVITSLSDSNFFGHLNDLLICINDEACTEEKKINRGEVWTFFQFFKMDEEEIRRFAGLLGAMSYSLRNGGGDFKDSLSEDLKSEAFVKARNEFFNQIFKKMSEPGFIEEINFYRNFLISETGTLGWLPRRIRTSLSKSSFNYLIRYPVDVQKDLWKDFRVINKTLNITLGCERENSLEVGVSDHLDTFLNTLFKGSQEDFFRTSLQSVTILKAAKEICPELAGYSANVQSFPRNEEVTHSVNFIDIMEKTTSLMLTEEYYGVVKDLHFSGVSDLGDPKFLVKYFSTDLFVSFLELIRVMRRDDPTLIGGTFNLIKNFPDSGFESLVFVLDWLKEKGENERNSVGRVWDFLGDDGKFFFFNFLDSHYKEKTNLPLLFDFYNSFLNLLSPQAVVLLEEFLNTDSRDQFLASLTEITMHLGDVRLLEEYRSFFSREHMLEILRIVSSRSVSEVEGSELLTEFRVEGERRLTPFVIQPEVVASQVKKCLKNISSSSVSFYDLLNYVPSDCQPLIEEDPFFKFLWEINHMSQVVMPGTGFNGTGFFSSDLLALATKALNNVSKKFASSNEEGLAISFDNFSSWINKDKRKENLKGLLGLVSSTSKKDQDIIGTLLDFYSLDSEFSYLSKYTDGLETLLFQHRKYVEGGFDRVIEPINYVQKEKFKCSLYHNPTVGGFPCPNKEMISTAIRRAIGLATNKNDENPTALEQILKMVAVDNGIAIPYESNNQSLKRVTLTESFKMFFEFTDDSLETNRFTLDHYDLPKADEAFFQEDDWQIVKDHAKGAPERKEKQINTMERIEVVIRDVRFDQNYLGAHYLNAVAKAESYDETVDAKYKILNTCVPLKFCGKFMNKAQHRLAKNSRDTFLSLLDANTKEDWKFGPYMQALLTSLVSSSPDKSQISSVVNKRIFGLNIQIPWLNSKKDLEKHNGKILGLVSMLGMFSNSSRVLKDRVSENHEEFYNFLSNPKLEFIDRNLLRNLDLQRHVPAMEKLLKTAQNDGFIDEVLSYLEKLSYEEQRLFENILFKGLYTVSYISSPEFLSQLPFDEQQRYKELSVLDALNVTHSVLSNFKNIKEVIDFDREFLIKANKLLDVINDIISGDDYASKVVGVLINEAFYFIKSNDGILTKTIQRTLSSPELISKIYEESKSSINLLEDISKSGSTFELVDFIKTFRQQNLDWSVFRQYLAENAASTICSDETGRNCWSNPNFRQFQKILIYLFESDEERFLKVIEFYSGKQNVKIKEFFNKVFPSIVN